MNPAGISGRIEIQTRVRVEQMHSALIQILA